MRRKSSASCLTSKRALAGESRRRALTTSSIEQLEERVLLTITQPVEDVQRETLLGVMTGLELAPSAATSAATLTQTFYVDLDGATEVQYDGPISVTGIEVPQFAAPAALSGQEAEITAKVQDLLSR